jgi:hypothetical protein
MITSEGSEREQGIRMTRNISEKDSRSQGKKMPTKKKHTHDGITSKKWHGTVQGRERQIYKKGITQPYTPSSRETYSGLDLHPVKEQERQRGCPQQHTRSKRQGSRT